MLTSEGITVRLAIPADAPALRVLLAELDAHYGGRAPPERIGASAVLLADPPAFGPLTLVAVEADRVLGVCILCALFPAHEMAVSWWLEDIFIAHDARGRGLGRQLLEATIALARERGVVRVSWTADRDNTTARGLYGSLGARLSDKLLYELALD